MGRDRMGRRTLRGYGDPGQALSGVARPLGKPKGVTGRLVAIGLNRGNRSIVTAAVTAAQIAHGDCVADVGFGGGLSWRCCWTGSA
jgi:hypothetical protein